MQRTAVGMAGVGLTGLALATWAMGGADWPRGLAALCLGGLAGLVLYHASFGFTAGWRQLLRERRGVGVRAQFLLIGLTSAVSYPLIGYGADLGLTVYPVVLPMGIVTAFGAFVFGIGMQLGGGCGSGTLFTAGGGSVRMVLTLAAFVAGSIWAVWDLPRIWEPLPGWLGIGDLPPVSLVLALGPPGAMAALAGALAVLWLGSVVLERRRHGAVEPLGKVAPGARWLTGPWSMAVGAAGLALVGILCLVLLQRPWGITASFALWGAKILAWAGVEVAAWPYWQVGWRAQALVAPLVADHVSLMDFGIVLGAMAAAGLAGRYRPQWRLSRRDVVTAILGGLLMGYGARLSHGCNIGAYVGGVISGSAHGVWWLFWAFLGGMVGVEARARIGMDPAWRWRASRV